MSFFLRKKSPSYVSHQIESYSQEGEDIILNRIFVNQNTGFYVDIGAHDPVRFSNTWLLYKKGWRGINIDANPNSITKFKKDRIEDINLTVGISSKNESLLYYEFNETALNTFDSARAETLVSTGVYKLIKSSSIDLRPLRDVLEEHIKPGQIIDLFNIDIEGLDLAALESNNWSLYSPRVIVVEDKGFDIQSPLRSEVYKFLTLRSYKIFSKLHNSLIFIRS